MTLTDHERTRLNALADQLIPARGTDRLSASQAGIFGPLFDRAALADAGLPQLYRDALAGLPENAPIWQLRDSNPVLFERIAETTAAIYFMSPEVRAEIGFPGREPRPARIDPAQIEGLLMPVVEGDHEPRPIS